MGADVEGARLAFQRIEVLGEGCPVPGQPFVQGGAGDVLDPFHHGDQPVVSVRGHRGEANSAVAHGDRRHPVMRRGGQERIPGGLAVVVGVGIDESRRHQQAARVELAPPRSDVVAHLGDAVARHGDVGPTRPGRRCRRRRCRCGSPDRRSSALPHVQPARAHRRSGLRASVSSWNCTSVRAQAAAAQFFLQVVDR